MISLSYYILEDNEADTILGQCEQNNNKHGCANSTVVGYRVLLGMCPGVIVVYHMEFLHFRYYFGALWSRETSTPFSTVNALVRTFTNSDYSFLSCTPNTVAILTRNYLFIYLPPYSLLTEQF